LARGEKKKEALVSDFAEMKEKEPRSALRKNGGLTKGVSPQGDDGLLKRKRRNYREGT